MWIEGEQDQTRQNWSSMGVEFKWDLILKWWSMSSGNAKGDQTLQIEGKVDTQVIVFFVGFLRQTFWCLYQLSWLQFSFKILWFGTNDPLSCTILKVCAFCGSRGDLTLTCIFNLSPCFDQKWGSFPLGPPDAYFCGTLLYTVWMFVHVLQFFTKFLLLFYCIFKPYWFFCSCFSSCILMFFGCTALWNSVKPLYKCI